MIFRILIFLCLFPYLFIDLNLGVFAQTKESDLSQINEEILHMMDKGNIPGLSLGVINKGHLTIQHYGMADVEKGIPTSHSTQYEIGSCTKAFTALLILALEKEGRLDLEHSVSDYLPWFKVYYDGVPEKITIGQLLHHTSGIPWHTLDKIPEGVDSDALLSTVKNINGITLNNSPGRNYEYASLNYDILGLIVEKVLGTSFEAALSQYVLQPLQLNDTGFPTDSGLNMSKGYKPGFFRPVEYEAPNYRGNWPSGYVVSSISDMTRWLKIQMGQLSSEMDDLVALSHQKDETVAPHGLSSYAKGWEVSLSGNRRISHSGLNPNYSSYIAFQPSDSIGVVVLSNANSNFTPEIGNEVINFFTNKNRQKVNDPDSGYDKFFSIATILLGIYGLLLTTYLSLILIDIVRSKRKLERINVDKIKSIITNVLFSFLLLLSIYLVPFSIANLSWDTAVVWSPISFYYAAYGALAAIGLTFIVLILTTFYPEQNKYKRTLPKIIIISVISGLSNMVLIFLITSSLYSNVDIKYLLFYYFVALIGYIVGRRFVQINLIKLSRDLVTEMRLDLIKKVLQTSYQKFEKLDRGRIYTILNDDIAAIGNSTNVFVNLVTNFVTVVFSFLYLATLAYWANALTMGVLIVISVMYYFVSQKSQSYFVSAAHSRNIFMSLLNGLIDGFKELSLHKKKKLEYKEDLIESANDYRNKIAFANIKFVNTFLIGESMLIIVLGAVAFAIPKVFPDIALYTLMSFIMILLYLIGPINNVLNSIPAIMELKVAWKRVKHFLSDIPANGELLDRYQFADQDKYLSVERLEINDVSFNYEGVEGFQVGPINLEVNKGEILFITGGNGSGKSTLAKLLTGLYTPDSGVIKVNSQVVNGMELSEYYSAVFSPVMLFDKLYEIELDGREKEVNELLKLLQLKDKVGVKGKKFSTINLSSGQRKRLALMQCYLENRAVFIFDEWAADQDPEYRRFFYKELLPAMKSEGKIVIAITHDDHYFHIADKIIKMDLGKIEFIKNTQLVSDPAI